MQRLVIDGSGQAKITAGRPERIMARAKYRVQNASHRRNIQQHLPGRMMELTASQAGPAEGVSMGTAIAFVVMVNGHDLFDNLVTARR